MISRGLRTLFEKEVLRFMRVAGQTLLSPLITTALYFIVFGYSIGGRLHDIQGVPYSRFLVPGLITLGVISNAFLNTASSLFMMKMQGTLIDLLVTPLSYAEVLAGFLGAAVVRALLVGALTWLVAAIFTGFAVAHPLLLLLDLLLISIAFGAMGLCVAIWADKFEQVNFVPTFVITPLTFLGGVFTSVSMLPTALRRLTLANPIFYLVDSVRFAMLGIADSRPEIGLLLLGVLCAASLALALQLLRSGYKLRG